LVNLNIRKRSPCQPSNSFLWFLDIFGGMAGWRRTTLCESFFLAWRKNGARLESSLSKKRHPFCKIEFHIFMDNGKTGW